MLPAIFENSKKIYFAKRFVKKRGYFYIFRRIFQNRAHYDNEYIRTHVKLDRQHLFLKTAYI